MYDGCQDYMRIGPIAQLGEHHWRDRAILLGKIDQGAGSQYRFGRTTPHGHEGLVSLSDILCYVPGMEIRSVIWLSVTEGETRQYRCAVLCGVLYQGAPSNTVRCWPVTADKIFPSSWLRGRSLDSSNPDLVDLLSRQSIVKMLRKITGPPLGVGNYVHPGISSLKTGPDSIAARLVESTFLERPYLTLNIEINSVKS